MGLLNSEPGIGSDTGYSEIKTSLLPFRNILVTGHKYVCDGRRDKQKMCTVIWVFTNNKETDCSCMLAVVNAWFLVVFFFFVVVVAQAEKNNCSPDQGRKSS